MTTSLTVISLETSFATFCELGSGRSCANAATIYAAPVGYSVAFTGAIWALGPAIIEPDREIPWISIAAGVAAGALAYGLSHALAPSP